MAGCDPGKKEDTVWAWDVGNGILDELHAR
jgi:hypothetical protein